MPDQNRQPLADRFPPRTPQKSAAAPPAAATTAAPPAAANGAAPPAAAARVAAPPAASGFDARQYLRKVNGSDYLEVKWRLLWMRTEHPAASIVTELHEISKDHAIFRAEVTLPSGASATGWGSETKRDFGDFLEKAETKALGRALAALGFGTQFSL